MTYYSDLSTYVYTAAKDSARCLNIGWLDPSKEFCKGRPTPKVLDALWKYCTIVIAETRGVHKCALCSPTTAIVEERDGTRLKLGGSEIRVFSADGKIFAAPNLIYHYAAKHNYMPPAPFLDALIDGTAPPDRRYFELLDKFGIVATKSEECTDRDKGFRLPCRKFFRSN